MQQDDIPTSDTTLRDPSLALSARLCPAHSVDCEKSRESARRNQHNRTAVVDGVTGKSAWPIHPLDPIRIIHEAEDVQAGIVLCASGARGTAEMLPIPRIDVVDGIGRVEKPVRADFKLPEGYIRAQHRTLTMLASIKRTAVAAPRRRNGVERFDPLIEGLSDRERMQMTSGISTDEHCCNDRLRRKAPTLVPVSTLVLPVVPSVPKRSQHSVTKRYQLCRGLVDDDHVNDTSPEDPDNGTRLTFDDPPIPNDKTNKQKSYDAGSSKKSLSESVPECVDYGHDGIYGEFGEFGDIPNVGRLCSNHPGADAATTRCSPPSPDADDTTDHDTNMANSVTNSLDQDESSNRDDRYSETSPMDKAEVVDTGKISL